MEPKKQDGRSKVAYRSQCASSEAPALFAILVRSEGIWRYQGRICWFNRGIEADKPIYRVEQHTDLCSEVTGKGAQ